MIGIRKPNEDDLKRFAECLAADKDHKGQTPDEWQAEGGEFWVFYDEENNRVWIRLERALRIHFQHDPAIPRRRLAPIVYKGLAWVIGAARSKKFQEVIFHSTEPRLIAFCKKLFGFKPVENNHNVRT